jgi:hypothetical protein
MPRQRGASVTESSDAETLPDLFAQTSGAITLSWFASDLSPTPDWSVPDTDSSGWCVLDGPAIRKHVLTLAAGLIEAGVAQGERVALMPPPPLERQKRCR